MCIHSWLPGSFADISKHEIRNPNWAAALYKGYVESGSAPFAKVNATWDSGFAHVLVTYVDEHGGDCLDIVVSFRSHHNVDYWLSYQAGNRCAPDVLYR